MRRTRTGIELRAKADPTLEQMFKDAATADDPVVFTTASARDGWSNYKYYLPANLSRMQDDSLGQRVYATFDGLGSSNLGNPEDSSSAPINLSWLRAVGISDEGITMQLPIVWTVETARQYTNAASAIVKKLYRERLQPYDVSVCITVAEL